MKTKSTLNLRNLLLSIAGGALLNCAIITQSHAQQTFLDHAQRGGFSVSVNPALSLMQSEGAVSFIGRQQWVGMEGAPQVYWGSVHMGFEKLRLTGGLQFSQDRLGVERHTNVSLFVSKAIRLSENDYLGISLSAGLVHFDARYSSLDAMDSAFGDLTESDALLGMGAVYYRPEAFYIGVSVPRFTSGGVGLLGDTRYNFENQYYLTGGFLWALGETMHLRPGAVVAFDSSTGTSIQASVMAFFNRAFGLGVGARDQGDLSGKLHYNFQGFGIGYSYQFNLRNEPLKRYINNSTHEVGLTYNFGGIQKLL